ncbi:MAG: IS66 family insertion sequence element accessory protein TnpB [Polaromonas sp.]
MRILVSIDPIDFRAGIDTLVRICRQRLQADPFSGGLYVFSNRRRSAIKILAYDGNGFWMCQKRLSSGRLAFWPDGVTPAKAIEACELQVLLMGGDPSLANVPQPWRRLRVAA